MREWSCSGSFTLTSGQLNRGAESHLTKQSVRLAPGQPGAFVWSWKIEADSAAGAAAVMFDRLARLLGSYGVEYDVHAVQIVEPSP